MAAKIKEPAIIIGCPRSGTTLLFTILSKSKHFDSLFEESRFIFKKYYLDKLKNGEEFFDDALSIGDLNEYGKKLLKDQFNKYSYSKRSLGLFSQKVCSQNPILKPLGSVIAFINGIIKNIFQKEYRIIEKTPRNCFKVEFMNKLFPDCKFIFLKRDGRSNISSLMEGWKKRTGFKGRIPRPNLPLKIKNFNGKYWRFALPPGWQDYINQTLEKVCAYQWLASNEHALKGLETIPEDRKYFISYEDLTENTGEEIQKLCEYLDIPYSEEIQEIAEKPPEVNYHDGKPRKDKWKKNEEQLKNIYPMIEPMMDKLGYTMN